MLFERPPRCCGSPAGRPPRHPSAARTACKLLYAPWVLGGPEPGALPRDCGFCPLAQRPSPALPTWLQRRWRTFAHPSRQGQPPAPVVTTSTPVQLGRRSSDRRPKRSSPRGVGPFAHERPPAILSRERSARASPTRRRPRGWATRARCRVPTMRGQSGANALRRSRPSGAAVGPGR